MTIEFMCVVTNKNKEGLNPCSNGMTIESLKAQQKAYKRMTS